MKLLVNIFSIALLATSSHLRAANYCGDLRNAYGPYDYTDRAFASNLELVEAWHFTPEVEKLIRGPSGPVGGELDYTLRAFPNHSRALAALAKLSLREKTPNVIGAKWSVACYFDRAIRFKPSDANVRTLYGSYLYKLGRPGEAIEQLSEAVRLDPENGTANHNLGLVYFQQKDYEKAVFHAKKADSLGFPLNALRRKLTEMGKWDSSSGK